MNLKAIINLPVYLKSGGYLGQIVDLNINFESGEIIDYLDKNKKTIRGLFEKCLVINKNQVLSITEDKMTVKDTFEKIENLVIEPIN